MCKDNKMNQNDLTSWTWKSPTLNLGGKGCYISGAYRSLPPGSFRNGAAELAAVEPAAAPEAETAASLSASG